MINIHNADEESTWKSMTTRYHTWYFKDPLIFNDKRILTPKYSGAAPLEVLHPFYFWIQFSDRISLFCTVYKLLF